jgi:collagen triple helix repeat protein
MNRLRHPVRAIREPFGTAGLAVACVALIAALGGSALAAKGALTGKQKKEVTKIAKKFAGKPGAQGPAGPAGKDGSNGAAGEKGATGAQGPAGQQGVTGATGTAGAEGKSVELVEKVDGSGEECEGVGGAIYEVEGSGEPEEICNGENGEEGSPWTLGGTLPPGATETGAWGIATVGEVGAPISFPIPLEQIIAVSHVHYQTDPDFLEKCGEEERQSVNAPGAKPGELCVFRGEHSSDSFNSILTPEFGEVEGTGTSGALIDLNIGAGGYAYGSFAVTGCSEEAGSPFPCP